MSAGAAPSNIQALPRVVHCDDAIAWLERSPVLIGCSLVTSMPDISEFPSYSVSEWKDWFIRTAELVLSRTPDEGVSIFYQSDIKTDGTWLDKGYLCQKAAEQTGSELLWHKIACRVSPGQTSFGRSGFTHVLCFSKGVRLRVDESTPDVIPNLGEKTWERGMGLEACLMIANFVLKNTATTTIVQPFCGQGGMLAAANAVGLAAIGIERSTKRAEAARGISVDMTNKCWNKE